VNILFEPNFFALRVPVALEAVTVFVLADLMLLEGRISRRLTVDG
jgi:hypothetical protein